MTQAQSSPSTAMAIANWFLKKSWDESNYPACDQLKLIKLVYYAHAWHLGNGAGPLFNEDVEAWPHGPVIRNLYIEFKDAGRDPIKKLGTRLTISDGNPIVETPQYDGPLNSYLTSVWGAYRSHTGIQLSNATHASGEPWRTVADHYDLDGKPTIPNELIADVFRKKIERTREK